MGDLLTTASTLNCPHGGMVAAVPSGPRVNLDGSPLVVATDTFTVAGCPFVLGLVPHPCALVQWIVPAAQCGSNQAMLLTSDSVGLCQAADGAVQGPVLVQETQARAGGR